MPKRSKPTSSFRVEGLEQRILLSAVPMDSAPDAVQEPLISDSVLMLDAEASQQAQNAAGSGGLYEEVSTLPSEEVHLSGEVAPGTVISAEVIYIADGTVLEDVRLSAATVYFGAANWSGTNEVYADELTVAADQSAQDGTTLVLGTRYTNASIALGFDDEGFELDSDEIGRLSAAGFEQLTIGLEDGSHDVHIDGLAYHGNLLLRSPQDGGEFYILSQIQHSGGWLRYEGSGQTKMPVRIRLLRVMISSLMTLCSWCMLLVRRRRRISLATIPFTLIRPMAGPAHREPTF